MFPLDGNISHPLSVSKKLKTKHGLRKSLQLLYDDDHHQNNLPFLQVHIVIIDLLTGARQNQSSSPLAPCGPPTFLVRSIGWSWGTVPKNLTFTRPAIAFVLVLPREIVFIPSGWFFQSQVRFRPRLLLPAVSDESVIMCGAGVRVFAANFGKMDCLNGATKLV